MSENVGTNNFVITEVGSGNWEVSIKPKVTVPNTDFPYVKPYASTCDGVTNFTTYGGYQMLEGAGCATVVIA